MGNKGILGAAGLCAVYVATAAAGYFGTDVVRKEFFRPDTVTSPVRSASPVPEKVPAENTMPTITSVAAPEYSQQTNSYRLEVAAATLNGDRLEYRLYHDDGTEVAAYSDNGAFDAVPPSENGTYFLEVMNPKTGQKTEMQKIAGFRKLMAKISAAKVEEILNSDYTELSKNLTYNFAGTVRIVCHGVKEGDRIPEGVSDVCDKVMMGTWRSVDVTNVGYDAENRVNSITVKVNYPE